MCNVVGMMVIVMLMFNISLNKKTPGSGAKGFAEWDVFTHGANSYSSLMTLPALEPYKGGRNSTGYF